IQSDRFSSDTVMVARRTLSGPLRISAIERSSPSDCGTPFGAAVLGGHEGICAGCCAAADCKALLKATADVVVRTRSKNSRRLGRLSFGMTFPLVSSTELQ